MGRGRTATELLCPEPWVGFTDAYWYPSWQQPLHELLCCTSNWQQLRSLFFFFFFPGSGDNNVSQMVGPPLWSRSKYPQTTVNNYGYVLPWTFWHTFGAQMMDLSHFGDPLAFLFPPLSNQSFHLSAKYSNIYLKYYHQILYSHGFQTTKPSAYWDPLSFPQHPPTGINFMILAL